MQNTVIQRYVCSLPSYEAALQALHGLQSNAEYLNLATQNNCNDSCKITDTRKYLLRTGITLEKLDTLSVIHVAGTKGKGSACAYTEAILREHGYNTGFFSSPHLISVRERIKINGQSLSQLLFAEYFWKVYEKLESTKEHESDMPMYFKFLTILMFNIFLDLNVDVAIIEVGIGGLKDSTNIVRNPVCVGISSLAMDHTSLLGNTLEDIAYQKSGIFKPKTIAFSVPQLPLAMHVLEKRSVEENCTLHIIPPFEEYTWENLSPILKIRNHVQKQNASLAIQMATTWIMVEGNKSPSVVYNTVQTNKVSYIYNNYVQQTNLSKIVSMDKIAMGLASCNWPGRMQILRSSIADFYLDGAHTTESIESCISWFNDVTNRRRGKKSLIFNVTGNRDSTKLMIPLKSLHFENAYFVPNYAGVESIDDAFNRFRMDEQKLKCLKNSEFWGAGSVIANSVSEVLREIKKDTSKHQVTCNNDEKHQVLVTGSLHLVGAVLAVLDPDLTMNTQF
ncbi:Folylpolyglutamate synthase, mitochondrial [Dufourea novaeangliae]|uniref:Folylpolyglutamate synthase n=2 Tax=Dufourea novaeangliae TaxID=178035 RepID=A0A154PI75_DUFNO|nr:Folylpolyglutamate synthase, mitochondrial [Dufourea novaeangliae]